MSVETAIAYKRQKSPAYGSLTADIIIYLLIGIIATITLLPFIFVISASFSTASEVAAGRVWLYPRGFSLLAYERLFKSVAIWRAFGNSVFFTAIITFFNVINSMLAGYALTQRDVPFRKGLIIYILIPMYFSGGLIPSFIIVSSLGLYNNLLAIILPGIVSIWNIILARTNIAGIPASLREAAIVDGASEINVFIRVILPLSKPIMAVLGLYTALSAWNAWFNYMIYVPSRTDWHPLQMFLTRALIWGNMNATLQLGENLDPEIMKQKMLMSAVASQLKFAVMVTATVPIIIVYPFVQKYFIQGALLGSLKE